MANSDSSAIVRFVQHVQAEPILETERAVIHDTVPTELMKPPKQHPLRGYLVTGAIAAVLGIGGAFYLAESGSEQAATSARAGLMGVDKAEHAKTRPAAVRHETPTDPTATPVALPLPERDSEAEAAPTAEPAPVAEASALAPTADTAAAEPAVATDDTEAAPAVAAEPAVEAAPAPPESSAADAEPAVAVAAPSEAAPAVAKTKKTKKSKAKRRSKKARKASRSKKTKKTVASAAGGKGTLMLGAKPPCRIYIDGRDTGKMTPQRGISLPAGKHKILLLNKEYKIKSRATVVIKSGKKTRVIRDLSDRIK